MTRSKRQIVFAVATMALTLSAITLFAKPPEGKGGGKGDGDGDNGPTGTIYFHESTTSPDHDWLRMNADGSAKTVLPANVHGSPSHSQHEGQRWFLQLHPVAGTYPDGSSRVDLFAVSENGASSVRLTNRSDLEPWTGGTLVWNQSTMGDWRWSKDDAEIAFIGRRFNAEGTVVEAGIYSAYVDYDVDGSPVGLVAQPQQALVALDLVESDPDWPSLGTWFPDAVGFDWSPDSTGIVYNSRDEIIWVVDLETLKTTPVGFGGHASWGTRGILFTTIGSEGQGIAIVNPDGTGFNLLLKNSSGGGGRVTTHKYPHWAHDGDFFVFQRSKGRPGDMDRDVIRVNHSGGSPSNLTTDIGPDLYPAGWR